MSVWQRRILKFPGPQTESYILDPSLLSTTSTKEIIQNACTAKLKYNKLRLKTDKEQALLMGVVIQTLKKESYFHTYNFALCHLKAKYELSHYETLNEIYDVFQQTLKMAENDRNNVVETKMLEDILTRQFAWDIVPSKQAVSNLPDKPPFVLRPGIPLVNPDKKFTKFRAPEIPNEEVIDFIKKVAEENNIIISELGWELIEAPIKELMSLNVEEVNN